MVPDTEGRTPQKRDWRVTCRTCDAEYTPKSRYEPEECYACGSLWLKTEVLN